MLAWSSRAPRVHTPPPPTGKVGPPAPYVQAPLLSRAAGQEPGALRPEQRDLYAAPSARARGRPGPVFFSSRAAGIQWAETLPPGPLRRHKRPFSAGAPDAPCWRGELEGERPGLPQRPDCVPGPQSEQGLGSGGRSQPEPAGQLWGEGQTEAHRRGVKGQGGLEAVEGPAPSHWAPYSAAHQEYGLSGGNGCSLALCG